MAPIHLFGPVSILARDGTALPVGGPRQRAVLATLAIQVGHPVTVAQIVESVWAENPPSTVANTLQVYISALRKSLAVIGIVIDRDGPTYRLRADHADIDVTTFGRLGAAGRAAWRTGDPRAMALLEEALAVCRGDTLAGLESTPLVEVYRNGIDQLRLKTELDYVSALCQHDRAEDAVVVASALVSRHPLDERCWAQLMTAHYYSGRTSDALAAYQRARRTLLDEIGVEPSRVLVDIQQAILQKRMPELRLAPTPAATPVTPDGDAAPTVSTVDPATPIVAARFGHVVEVYGRAQEVADIVGFLRRGHVVTIIGLGGIGKSALAIAVADVYAGKAGHPAYAEVSSARTPDDLVGLVCRGLEIDETPYSIDALVRSRPAGILVVDDADDIPECAEVLQEIVRRCPELRLLVTSRAPLGIRGEVLVRLTPLPTAEPSERSLTEVVFRVAAERARPGISLTNGETVRSLCAMSDGIPLVTQGLAARLRTSTPERVLEHATRPGALAGILGPPWGSPRQRTFGEVLGWSIDHVPDSVLAVLHLHIFAGGPLTPSFVQAVFPDAPIDDDLDALQRLGLLEGPDDRGRFRVLTPVAEVGWSRLGPLGREVAAAFVAAACDLVAPSLAAARSNPVGDVIDDECAIRRAAWVAVDLQDTRRATILVVALTRHWQMSDQVAEGQALTEAAMALPLDDADRAAAALVAGQLAGLIQSPDAERLLRAGLDNVAGTRWDGTRLVVNGWCHLGAWHIYFGTLDEARACAVRAAEVAGEVVTLRELAVDFRGFVAARQEDYEEAVACALESLELLRPTGDLQSMADVMSRLSMSLCQLGRLDEASACLDEAFDLTRLAPIGRSALQLVSDRCWLDLLNRLPATVVGQATELLRIASTPRDRFYAAQACRTLAVAHTMLGDLPMAARCEGAAVRLHQDGGMDPDTQWIDAARPFFEPARAHPAYRTNWALGNTNPEKVIADVIRRGPQ